MRSAHSSRRDFAEWRYCLSRPTGSCRAVCDGDDQCTSRYKVSAAAPANAEASSWDRPPTQWSRAARSSRTETSVAGPSWTARMVCARSSAPRPEAARRSSADASARSQPVAPAPSGSEASRLAHAPRGASRRASSPRAGARPGPGSGRYSCRRAAFVPAWKATWMTLIGRPESADNTCTSPLCIMTARPPAQSSLASLASRTGTGSLERPRSLLPRQSWRKILGGVGPCSVSPVRGWTFHTASEDTAAVQKEPSSASSARTPPALSRTCAETSCSAPSFSTARMPRSDPGTSRLTCPIETRRCRPLGWTAPTEFHPSKAAALAAAPSRRPSPELGSPPRQSSDTVTLARPTGLPSVAEAAEARRSSTSAR
mmetsp:Transcript_111894/g.241256  ORF Transcript_111894/g.241256 Transcript_111894/m.241256 type:complete len:371 (-) Transcript_111894:596-1708(-)